MTDGIKQKALELGQALYESIEATVLHAAEMNMEQDSEAQELIEDFQNRQQKMQDAEEKKIEVDDKEWDEFNKIQEKMKQNKAIQAYFNAMNNFQSLLQEANSMINQVLNGGSCTPSDCASCSSDCH